MAKKLFYCQKIINYKETSLYFNVLKMSIIRYMLILS